MRASTATGLISSKNTADELFRNNIVKFELSQIKHGFLGLPFRDLIKRHSSPAAFCNILNSFSATLSSQFPNTIAGVIYQSGAFTAVSDGQINQPIAEGSTVYKAAQDAKNGWDPTGGCIYYFNPATATNKWIWSRPLVKTIGKHRFCK